MGEKEKLGFFGNVLKIDRSFLKDLKASVKSVVINTLTIETVENLQNLLKEEREKLKKKGIILDEEKNRIDNLEKLIEIKKEINQLEDSIRTTQKIIECFKRPGDTFPKRESDILKKQKRLEQLYQEHGKIIELTGLLVYKIFSNIKTEFKLEDLLYYKELLLTNVPQLLSRDYNATVIFYNVTGAYTKINLKKSYYHLLKRSPLKFPNLGSSFALLEAIMKTIDKQGGLLESSAELIPNTSLILKGDAEGNEYLISIYRLFYAFSVLKVEYDKELSNESETQGIKRTLCNKTMRLLYSAEPDIQFIKIQAEFASLLFSPNGITLLTMMFSLQSHLHFLAFLNNALISRINSETAEYYFNQIKKIPSIEFGLLETSLTLVRDYNECYKRKEEIEKGLVFFKNNKSTYNMHVDQYYKFSAICASLLKSLIFIYIFHVYIEFPVLTIEETRSVSKRYIIIQNLLSDKTTSANRSSIGEYKLPTITLFYPKEGKVKNINSQMESIPSSARTILEIMSLTKNIRHI